MFLRKALQTLLFALGMSAMGNAIGNEAAPLLSPEQQQLKAAWERFCDNLKSSGNTLLELDKGRALDSAEGFQYLAMLTGMSIERVQYYDQAARPIVARNLDGYKKIGLDSSDNSYRMVRFEPGGQYRIHGVRGSTSYMGFQINRGQAAVANLNDSEMSFEEDGSFELYLGGEKRGANWVGLPEGADNLYIREIFIDWGSEKPSPMWIERLDTVAAPAPLDVETMVARLEQINTMIDRNVALWDGYVSTLRETRYNSLPQPAATTGQGGSADNLYSGGYFAVAEDEALLIETTHVDARLWNVQLGNLWFQSLDYQYRQTSLNSTQVQRDSDGRYRIVIAHTDPGVANWLDTAGHAEGVIYYRWNQAAAVPGAPVVRLVKLSQLDALLPADTARVSASEREQILRERYRDVARRFAL
jgi:hypothetical protein